MRLFIKTVTFLSIILFNFACTSSSPVLKPDTSPDTYEIIDTTKKHAVVQKAILKLDTKGHAARVSGMIITKNGNIITSSVDKTVIVWDTEKAKQKRKILGEIGDGAEGMVNAMALSPDEKYLATGGWFSNKLDNRHSIRIYDYKSGKLVKLLISHADVLIKLYFSRDGKYLVSASADKSIKIWSVEDNFSLKDTLKFNYNINDAKIIHYENRNFALISAGKQLTLYDIEKKEITQSYRADTTLTYLAYNDRDIAVSTNTFKFFIFDTDLNLIKTVKTKTVPSELAYSPNLKIFITGSASFPSVVNIYDASKGYKKISSFFRFNNMAYRVGFMDNTTAVAIGGDNKDIYTWDIYSNKVKKKISGVGKTIWSVNIHGDTIEWGNTPDRSGINHFASLQKSMNLKSFNISYLPSVVKNTIPTVNGRYSLSHASLNPNGYDSSILNVKKDGVIVASIVRGSTSGNMHRCYGWYRDYIVSGGYYGTLYIYNKQGTHIASLIGHTGTIWSLGLDGDKLISGSDDQTMMIWDLSKAVTLHKKLQLNMEYINSYAKDGTKTEDIVQACKELGIDDIYIGSHIKPIVRIFVSKDNEYVLWSDDGFFDSSKKGAKYVGYHINQGEYKEAEYVTVDALYSTFYRPDLIQKALNSQSLQKYAKNINISALLSDGLAPKVQILTKTRYTQEQDLNLEVQVCPTQKGGFDNLTLMINSTPVSIIDTSRALKLKKHSGKDGCFIYNQSISLANGENNIGFKATNRAGNIESKPAFLHVRFDQSGVKSKLKNRLSEISEKEDVNDLHILAIAVNNYKDRELQLKYSINDATQMLETIKTVAKPLFHNIHVYKLFDKDVTKRKIEKAFKSIKSTRNDVFLLYIAGHGITDEYNGNYYFIPYDFTDTKNIKAIQRQGIGQKDLMLGLSGITALKSLVLLDTCNSGSFVEATVQKTTTNRLAKATGRATISASSRSQVALEGYKGHGVFTYTLLEALRGKGYGNNRKITINELSDYVEDVLPSRTYNRWGYRQIPQSSMYGTNFNIGVK